MNEHPSSAVGDLPVNREIATLPLPSDEEVERRSSLFRQAFRFVVLNLKILRLSRQHH